MNHLSIQRSTRIYSNRLPYPSIFYSFHSPSNHKKVQSYRVAFWDGNIDHFVVVLKWHSAAGGGGETLAACKTIHFRHMTKTKLFFAVATAGSSRKLLPKCVLSAVCNSSQWIKFTVARNTPALLCNCAAGITTMYNTFLISVRVTSTRAERMSPRLSF